MESACTRDGWVFRSLALFVSAFLALAAPARLLADGDSRVATAKEKEFHARVAGILAKAVPPGPAGWAEERETVEPLERMSTGAEKYPFSLSYRASWSDSRRCDEAERKQLEALDKIMATPDPELQDLTRRNDKLAAELGAALGKSDMADAERIGRELEELRKKMEKRTAVQDAKVAEAQRATSPRDAALGVSLSVNTFSQSFSKDVAAEPAAGGGLVYRSQGEFDPSRGWSEGRTYVFLGKGWQLKRDGSAWMEAPQRPGVSSLAVQTIVVTVEADSARARGVLAKLDWASLQKLLAN